jgi:hypothetical protein
MLDVHFPTTDGRTLVLTRYTKLTRDQKLLLKQLNLILVCIENLIRVDSATESLTVRRPWSRCYACS